MGNIFQTILTQPLFNLLIVLTLIVPNQSIGWAIILLTILIRAILIPSSAQSIIQQQKLKKMQPELKAVQEKYKDDREGQAREMMALYKRYDIHPLGSCLPLLIQLPVLFALYHVFVTGLDTSRFDLLYSFVPRPETLNTIFVGIDLARPDRLFILPVIAGILQFIQSRMLLAGNKSQTSDDPTQKILQAQMLYFLPVLTVIFSVTLPAALPLYWIVTTLFGIAQQFYLFRRYAEPDIIAVQPAVLPGVVVTPPIAPVVSERHGSVEVTVRKKGA